MAICFHLYLPTLQEQLQKRNRKAAHEEDLLCWAHWSASLSPPSRSIFATEAGRAPRTYWQPALQPEWCDGPVCFEVLLMPTHTRTLVGHMCQSQARRRFINTPHVSVEKAFKLCEAGCWGYTELQQQPRDVVTPVQWVTCRTAP